MPTISVDRDSLFEKIGQKFTEEEFDQICFEFGIEVDDVIHESPIDGEEATVTYKIDIGANRCDLLCIEGLAQALRVFLEKCSYPDYRFINSKDHNLFIKVEKDVSPIRPYVGVAVLRDIDITQKVFDSLIDLQEKLHFNIGRRRKLVAIGVHDLDTIQLPLRYTARPPSLIKFVPLTIDEELGAEEMFQRFEKTYLKEFLPIIRDSPAYPLILDSRGTVLSLPPIINGKHSQVKLTTRNILIECTGTDSRRTEVALLTLCTMLSEHCNQKYTIETGTVVPWDSSCASRKTPTYSPRTEYVTVDYLNRSIGIRQQYIRLLRRMSLQADIKSGTSSNEIQVTITPTRSDILHVCDVMEDAAIAYGYNNIQKVYPSICTTAKEQFPNRFYEKLRLVVSQCQFVETLSFVVCPLDDLSIKMESHLADTISVKIDSTHELNVSQEAILLAVRCALLPGLLKTLSNNRNLPVPLKLFEIGDVVLRVTSSENACGARNERRLCAVYCGKTSGFEIIKGLLDKILNYVGVTFSQQHSSSKGFFNLDSRTLSPSMFPGRSARVMLMGVEDIGVIGVVHPQVLKNFELNYPCSALEINVERLIEFASH